MPYTDDRAPMHVGIGAAFTFAGMALVGLLFLGLMQHDDLVTLRRENARLRPIAAGRPVRVDTVRVVHVDTVRVNLADTELLNGMDAAGCEFSYSESTEWRYRCDTMKTRKGHVDGSVDLIHFKTAREAIRAAIALNRALH